MKKFNRAIQMLALCLSIAVLVSCLSVVAFATAGISAEVVYLEGEGNEYFTISGSAPVNSQAVVTVYGVPSTVTTPAGITESNIMLFATGLTSTTGTFSINAYQMGGIASGNYNIFVMVEGVGNTMVPFAYFSVDGRDAVKEDFNDNANIETAIVAWIDKLGVPLLGYDSSNSDFVADVFASLIPKNAQDQPVQFTDVQAIKDIAQKALILNAIKNALTDQAALDLIQEHATTLGMNVSKLGSNNLYNLISAQAFKIADFTDLEANSIYLAAWDTALILAEVNLLTDARTIQERMLVTYKTTFMLSTASGYSDYAEMTELKRALVFGDIKDDFVSGKYYYTVQQARNAFTKYVGEVKSTIPPKRTGGGDGGTVATIGIAPMPTAAPIAFTDLASVQWATASVNTLVGAGVVKGYEDNTFRPQNAVTRAEFSKMLVMVLKLDLQAAKGTFADAGTSEWFTPYVEALAAAGVAKGLGDGNFGVDMPISRQDAATMINRAVEKYGIKLTAGTPKTFADSATIADYAKDSVNALSAAGIINGTDGNFLPTNNITRAESAKILADIYNAK